MIGCKLFRLNSALSWFKQPKFFFFVVSFVQKIGKSQHSIMSEEIAKTILLLSILSGMAERSLSATFFHNSIYVSILPFSCLATENGEVSHMSVSI